MHLLVVLIVVAANAAMVHAYNASTGTAAARFWEEALPGTPMPVAIADLVQEGIDHSPLVEHQFRLNGPCYTLIYHHCEDGCPPPPSSPDKAVVPPGLFFHKVQIHVGSTMTISLPPLAVPGILPRDVAEKVPFSNLSSVLSMFNIAPNSIEAAKVGETLRRCQATGIAGEHKACTASLEATVQSAMKMLDSIQVWAVASALPATGLPLQGYVIQEVQSLDGDQHVGCHNVPFPYAVYQCHTTGLQNQAYVISLRGLSNGVAVDMAAICHLNTSNWRPTYPAFRVLDTQPGGTPVCHFMTYANMMFGKKQANT